MKLFTKSLALIVSTIFISCIANAQDVAADRSKALDLIRKNVATLMLTDTDIGDSYISDTYTTPEGITMVYLQQAYIGIAAPSGQHLPGGAWGYMPHKATLPAIRMEWQIIYLRLVLLPIL